MATLNIKGFPEDLYRLLEEKAQENRRSLSSEVIYLLECALGSHNKKNSVLSFRGLGKEYWKGIKTSKYINTERKSWESLR